MYLTRLPSGIYYLYFNDHCGRKQKISTRTKKKSGAIQFLKQFDGRYVRREKMKITVSQFRDEVLSHLSSTHRKDTIKIYHQAFQTLIQIVGNVNLTTIKHRQVDLYISERLKVVKPITVNTRLIALKSAFNIAVRWEYLTENPFTKVRFCAVPQRVPIFFTKEDFQRMLAAIKEPWLKEAVVFATLTGIRQSELTHLRWRDVNYGRKSISIESSSQFSTKGGKRRDIPLSETAVYLLRQKSAVQQHDALDDYVFRLNDRKILEGWLSHKFKYYVYACRLSDDRLHWHSLRHTFASWLVQDGVSIYAVKELLGHADVKTTQVYSHLQESGLHAEVNRINFSLN
ncbi:MAG: site-specific integrase [Ignavibacteriales bacterium]|nr:site-specific integrase [Ignavibacteriales bacterium]